MSLFGNTLTMVLYKNWRLQCKNKLHYNTTLTLYFTKPTIQICHIGVSVMPSIWHHRQVRCKQINNFIQTN